MRIEKQIFVSIGLLLAGLFSCSRQACIPTQATYPLTAILGISDSLSKKVQIDSALYEIKSLSFYEPALAVKDSFNNAEKHRMGISDDALFGRRSELLLDLTHIPENAFVFPLCGARLLSSFGKRNGRMHTGMDLKINRHDTISTAFDGIVRMAGWSRGYGNVIVIRHYNGLETVYAHNSRHLVHSGEHVRAGTAIALTGATGRATTDHMHFEIRINGTPIDPRLIIDFDTQTLLRKRLVFSPDTKGKIQVQTV